MKNMGSEAQILHLIFIIFVLVFFLNAYLLMADSSMNDVQNSYDNGLNGLYREEYNEDGKETQIQKVSGEDEKRDLVLEKFRVLLGLRNFHIISTKKSHVGDGFLSPSPAPSIEEAPAPAPVPVAHHHLHTHFLSPRSNLPPLHHVAQRGHGDKARAGKIVIAVVVSSGVVTVISALGVCLFCWKFKKGRRRSARTMSVSGSTGNARGRSKKVNSPNNTSKVSLELGPEHFYLNSLGPGSEVDASPVKHTHETVNISWTPKETNTSLDVESESGKDSKKSHSNNVSCSSVEEILSVHEIREAVQSVADDGYCSRTNEIVQDESLSSDDESFHSFCDSHSSNVRISNASEGDLSDPSEVFSPPRYPKRSTPGRSKTPTISYSIESPTPPMTPTLTPPLRSKIEASPLNTPCNLRQSTPTSQCSSNSSQHFPSPSTPPPPPPPPPPYLHFSSSQCPSTSALIKSKTSCLSATPKVPSASNSDSSSGSNQILPNDNASSINHKPQPGSTVQPGSARNIPPPPCPPLLPPPFAKGNSNSLQPPPPPPGLLPQFTPVGKDGAPLPKLKPLHWDKVRATPDRSMVWDKLKSSSFEFDEKMIESLFGYKLQNGSKNDDAKRSPSPSKHILEPKRLQNITIVLKSLNATAEQVCNALVQGNGLCLQQLEALVKMAPTKEEESMLLNYQGNIDELGSAEKFVKGMLNVPFAFLRIEAMLYRDTFEDEVVHLRKSFAMLEEACKELRSSRLFLKLLEAVLKTGNRMNVGTIRGGARAFKLDALLKLADVKGTDGKTTLLHFVVQEMIRSEGIRESDIITKKNNQKIKSKIVEQEENYRRTGLDHVSGLSEELCNVKKTATIDLDVLASSVSNLSDGMVKLQHLIHEDLSIDDQKGTFSQSMRSFLDYAEKNIKELKKDEDQVLLHVREITEYFHGDVSKDEANPLRIFVIVRDFLGMLDQVCKEVRSSKIPKSPNLIAPFR